MLYSPQAEAMVQQLNAAPLSFNTPEVSKKMPPKQALLTAIENENGPEIEKLLTDKKNLTAVDSMGRTALHYTAAITDIALARKLINAGAAFDNKDNLGYTPLHMALFFKNRKLTQLLLEHGADPNAQNKKLETPLMLAIANTDEKSTRLLLAYGANPHLANEKNETPIYLAFTLNQPRLVRILITEGFLLPCTNALFADKEAISLLINLLSFEDNDPTDSCPTLSEFSEENNNTNETTTDCALRTLFSRYIKAFSGTIDLSKATKEETKFRKKFFSQTPEKYATTLREKRKKLAKQNNHNRTR